MKRRLQWFCSCALLCALLVTAALPAPAAAASTGFSDVPESHWAADSIRRAVDLGLFQGQTPTRFGLGAPMTRGAFVVALCRLFGWEMVTPEAGAYTDNQDKSAWYYSAVETAYANGAITRQTDTFRPREPITREELAVMLVRAMGYGTIAGLAQDLPMPFRDVTTNVGYIAMAHELGLVNGTAATTFSPDQTATREQAAVMLIRLYDSYHAAAPEKTGIAYSAEGLTDLTGYGAVAVGGARLIYAGESRLAGTPDAETAAALQETITAAGAVPLLHVGGSASALKDDPSHTAEVLAAAVESGGYEGLFLDLAELSSAQKKDFTALAEALRAELGEDRLLYLMVEAPVWQGAAYNGYDYAALSAAWQAMDKAEQADAKISCANFMKDCYDAISETRRVGSPAKFYDIAAHYKMAEQAKPGYILYTHAWDIWDKAESDGTDLITAQKVYVETLEGWGGLTDEQKQAEADWFALKVAPYDKGLQYARLTDDRTLFESVLATR